MGNNIAITAQNTQSPAVREKLSQDLAEQNKTVYRRQGLTAQGFDKIKSLTGLGRSQKKILQKIEDYKAGKTDYESTDKYIKDYKYGQRDATEITLDILTGASSFGMYSASRKLMAFARPFLDEKINLKAGKYSKIAGVGLAVLTGMTVKPLLRFIDRIYLKRKEKKDNKTFWKDTLTGALDGAMAPVAILKNGFLGVPLVLGENTIQRYLAVKRDDKKSVNDFIDKQKDNLAIKAAGAGLLAYKSHKLTSSLKSWEKAANKALENIKDLKPFEKVENTQGFTELAKQAQILLDPKFIMEILGDGKTIEEKMRLIEEKNIFLPKFLQTIPENVLGMLKGFQPEFMGMKLSNLDDLQTIITRFKSDCPQSRTVKEAQEFISKTYGDKYTIIQDKALGVGTVAETFLAKDNTTGKEVVLKFLKKGISKEKIENDRKVFIDALKEANKDNPEKADYLARKINSLYDAWVQETDMAKEMEATQILGRNARHYNAVKPIEVKDNIYVMEKAPGVQFNEFIDDMMKQNKKISEKDMFSILTNYFQVFFEQLLSVPKKGMKVMHADPHPGNVFIDVTNREKPFTFIDTGNVLRYSPEEAIENTLNHLDYFIGNTTGIAKALLRNANLPEGMTMKQAQKIVEDGLKEKVYNGHTNLFGENLFKEVNNVGLKVMEENNIIPNINNTNLLKAEITYLSNLTCLKDIQKIIDKNSDRLTQVEAKEQLKLMLNEIRESVINSAINNKRYTTKQIKERLKFIDENKEQFYSTVLTFIQGMK